MYNKNENCKTGDCIQKLRQNDLIPQLSEDEVTHLDTPLTLPELKDTLEKCAKNKSPGNDGLTQEFYSHFWEAISHTLYASYVESIKSPGETIYITTTKHNFFVRKGRKR